MTWNYRLVRSNNILSIREVYYDENNKVQAMSKNPITIEAFEDEGESVETVLDILEKIKSSIEKYGVLDDPYSK